MTSENQFNKVITKALLNHNFPGISIAVSHSRGQLLTFSDGLTDANSGLLISPDTLFSVASLTKFLTALIIMQAERLGHLSVTDLVVQYYPALQCAQDSKMQLKHLLTHSSGLPGLPCRFLAKNLTEQNSSDSGLQLLTTEDLVAHINQLEPELLAPPGALYSYSNESYCILGGIIETVFQLPYPEVAKKLIFEPLALHNSAIGGKQARGFKNMARPLLPSKQELIELPDWDAPLFYPAGGLLTTPSDLISLFAVLKGDNKLLSRQQSHQMINRQALIASRPSPDFGYGYGLEIEHLKTGSTMAWHTGQRQGWSSFVGIIPDQDISVAIAINVADAPVASLGHVIISELSDFTTTDLPWLPVEKPPHAFDGNPDQFTGRYGSLELGTFDAVYSDGEFMLQTSNGDYTFEFHGTNHGRVAGQTFQFLAGNKVHCQGLAFGLRVLPRLV
ncbi:MAG: beta-lactamase family protein [Gammaproteobacteria bacterium]|jgi:CubicO group peptidase (beta-lactamase class C family)|nr:beta-lactamase family protein [Gammaproteobacteria bacterium]MBT5205198.1 beta-lactamase family protein [Gammaproteobacteria bacterium]MBT5603241.1 beta-lactamase family protein [Gammaproteobacteria bacterium]MBT6244773.1 beta-lactamase family protein [Gammaproteobacteria bacterium]